MNEGRPNIWFHSCPLISNIPAFSCLLTSSHYLLPFSPSLSFSRIATVNKECAVFPQALKESLTLHSHNHFRPGCLGRHLHWDLPATRCRQNQTSEQRKSWKTKKKSTVTVRQSEKEQRDQSENMKHMSPDDLVPSCMDMTHLKRLALTIHTHKLIKVCGLPVWIPSLIPSLINLKKKIWIWCLMTPNIGKWALFEISSSVRMAPLLLHSGASFGRQTLKWWVFSQIK